MVARIMREVVILDVKYRMTLTAIRSLGKRGVKITAVAFETTRDSECLGFYSKYVSHKIKVPDPSNGVEAFLDALGRVGLDIRERTGEKPVLIVPGSQSMHFLTQHVSTIENYYSCLLVDHAAYTLANNTQTLLKMAGEIGVDVPSTTWLYEKDALETVEQLADRIAYPVVIKYREGEKLPLKAKERYEIVEERSSFIAHYSRMHEIQPSPLVQEYVRGNGYGVSAVFDAKSRPIEIFAHERLREFPISGGPSTYCKSVWDERMVSQAIQLLKALNWKGYAMVEFKGYLGGPFKLMEINPRFWGSMALSHLSNCDLAYRYYASLVETQEQTKRTAAFDDQYKLGVKMRFRIQDLLAIKDYFFVGRTGLKAFAAGVLSQLNPFVKDGLFSYSDPMPGLMYIKSMLMR